MCNRTDDSLHGRNRNFPLDHVHGTANVTNLTLHVAQSQIRFTKPDAVFYPLKGQTRYGSLDTTFSKSLGVLLQWYWFFWRTPRPRFWCIAIVRYGFPPQSRRKVTEKLVKIRKHLLSCAERRQVLRNNQHSYVPVYNTSVWKVLQPETEHCESELPHVKKRCCSQEFA